jgi:hypothetical protein
VSSGSVKEEDTPPAAVTTVAARPKTNQRAQWSTVSHRRRVDDTRKELSDRYCEMLDSFRRDHHAMAGDRVRRCDNSESWSVLVKRAIPHSPYLLLQTG